MKDINDTKLLILFILVADVVGSIVYGLKGNVVGIFNCVAWAVVAGFILLNVNKVLK